MACALTTFDNPFSPFDEFEQWFQYDCDKGYYSCSYLDRIAHTSDQLSEKENELIIEKAIDDIIKYDVRNIYKKVYMKESA